MFASIKLKILLIVGFSVFCVAPDLRAEEPVLASWYGAKYRGKPTASGERFDPARLTAAHPTLPFGTRVEIRRWADGRRVVVRVNDRGPHGGGRAIDVSEAAARALGLIADGTGLVTLHPMTDLARR
jgi:rare lipoprotein A